MQKTAVIVEDNKALAESFELVLREVIGLTTHVIHDGQEASHYLVDAVPDLLLLDLHLPHVNGQAILEQLAQNAIKYSHMRIIVATADVFLDQAFEHTYPAVSKVMFKPVSINTLITTIRSLLSDTTPSDT